MSYSTHLGLTYRATSPWSWGWSWAGRTPPCEPPTARPWSGRSPPRTPRPQGKQDLALSSSSYGAMIRNECWFSSTIFEIFSQLVFQQNRKARILKKEWFKEWSAIWYYMARWEKSGKGKNRWETSHFCRPEPRPTTPAAYVWYINVFIPKQKIFKTEYQPIIIERQRITQTYTESWYLLTVWQLFHNYSVQFVSKEQFQSQFQLQSCLCVYWLS